MRWSFYFYFFNFCNVLYFIVLSLINALMVSYQLKRSMYRFFYTKFLTFNRKKINNLFFVLVLCVTSVLSLTSQHAFGFFSFEK